MLASYLHILYDVVETHTPFLRDGHFGKKSLQQSEIEKEAEGDFVSFWPLVFSLKNQERTVKYYYLDVKKNTK